MAPREELIASAVTFLQDPSVASSPIEKRVSFLQSKNLTQEEVNIALSRVGEDPSAAAAATASASPAPSYSSQPVPYRQPQPPQGYGYPPYNQWQPPPEPPKRDWRDWFIMATVVGGVGYGLYTVTKRYIAPLIAPPTPPQLEQDKEHIDEQFSRAFTLIEQLSADTAALKTAEEARTERLDGALKEVENLVSDLKNSSRRRDDETRRISDEVKSLKDAIPKALEGAREGNENRLKELGTELKSLKTLLGNRLGAGAATPVAGRTLGSTPVPSTPRPAPEETPATSTAPATTNNLAATVTPAEQEPTPAAAPASTSQSPNPLSQLGRSASIPAWQMAAANRSKANSQSSAPATPAETTASPSLEQSAPPS
ncbi:peroxisomal docking factor component [Penicillium coprophilum]|uniref:peroxisomal docking factor component n=1 Tax=Penicillium coprophilum TaxID=36646 RepID=UPI00239B0DB6|nr:peroxisomal docking factor component [Penicillium coprophilum]KAJ5158449.1 peroxisomal docking factor component [Penicillium coprophilum]